MAITLLRARWGFAVRRFDFRKQEFINYKQMVCNHENKRIEDICQVGTDRIALLKIDLETRNAKIQVWNIIEKCLEYEIQLPSKSTPEFEKNF